MQQNNGQVGAFSRLEPYSGSEAGLPWYRSSRARLFFVVFGVTLAAGLLWTLLQPVVYRSSATVLMTAPTAIDASVSEADIQNVAIQRTILLGSEITLRLAQLLDNEYGLDLSFDELADLLRVNAVPETNLVEMAAEGREKSDLPLLVNGWIDVYLQVRAEEIAQSRGNTEQIVQEELAGLAVKIEAARDSLETYREENEILSVERQENEVMARLDGLNKALNTAIEEEVKARAHLDTMREAVQQGQNLVPSDQRRDVTALENELQDLRGEYVEMTKRYTMEYINKQPQFRAVPERIAELEQELADIYRAGRQAELGSAEQAYAASRQTVAELERKLDDHKSAVASFNRIYATHQALADDLARLEELSREAQARLVQVQVSRVEKYPQVSVIERPAREAQRVGPDYWTLLGGTLLASVVLGIFAVWLQGFLSPREPRASYVTLSGVHLYPQEVNGELAYTSNPRERLGDEKRALLTEQGEEKDRDPGR